MEREAALVSSPAQNGPLSPEITRDWKVNHAEYRDRSIVGLCGVADEVETVTYADCSAEKTRTQAPEAGAYEDRQDKHNERT